MKIAICGKGGSGKSSMVTLLAKGARDRGYQVLVVDSDESNSGLYRVLGFDRVPTPLMELVGGRKGLKEKMGKPQVLGQAEIRPKDIPLDYMLAQDGIRMVAIGKILQSLEGCACPMGVLSREFLKKLRLDSDEIVLVDMEAGVEHFGRGVETSIDTVLIVVEPSLESLELAERINGLANGIGIGNIWAVLNKITSEGLDARLRDELGKRNIEVIGSILNDAEISEACLEGFPIEGCEVANDVAKILDALLKDKTSLQKKD